MLSRSLEVTECLQQTSQATVGSSKGCHFTPEEHVAYSHSGVNEIDVEETEISPCILEKIGLEI